MSGPFEPDPVAGAGMQTAVAPAPGSTAALDAAQWAAEQRALTQLGLTDLRQRWEMQPDRQTVNFGAGEPAHQSIEGNPTSAFHGVCVFNPTGRPILLGMSASGGVGSPVLVPAGTLLIWPAEYTDLDLALANVSDASGAIEAVTVLRLRYPPLIPQLFPLTSATCSNIRSSQAEVAISNAAAVVLAKPNPVRRGLTIVNFGAQVIWLGLAGQVPAVGTGLRLKNGGGEWNGKIGEAIFLGEVQAIAETAPSAANVLEA